VCVRVCHTLLRFREPESNRYSVTATWGPVTSFPLYKSDLFGASYPRNYGGRWTRESRTDSAARPETRDSFLRARGTAVASSRDGPRRNVVCGSSRDHFGNQFRERVEAPRCWVPRAVRAIIQRGLILPACSGSRRSDSRGSTSSFRFFPSDRQERSFRIRSICEILLWKAAFSGYPFAIEDLRLFQK